MSTARIIKKDFIFKIPSIDKPVFYDILVDNNKMENWEMIKKQTRKSSVAKADEVFKMVCPECRAVARVRSVEANYTPIGFINKARLTAFGCLVLTHDKVFVYRRFAPIRQELFSCCNCEKEIPLEKVKAALDNKQECGDAWQPRGCSY